MRHLTGLVLMAVCTTLLLAETHGLKPNLFQKPSVPPVIRQYCDREFFNATCPPDTVILMAHARYGRMEIGRCMQKDLGFKGCSTDVLSHMDAKCSGRRDCVLKVPGDEIYATMPCTTEVTPYLEASYSCVQVLTANRQECHHHDVVIKRRAAKEGYIASIVTDELSYGSSNCPWRLEALPGQRINISRLDFIRHSQTSAGSGNSPRPEMCYEIAIIKENINGQHQTERKKQVLSCGNERRYGHVYLSGSSAVEIVIPARNTAMLTGTFLLHYTVVGCGSIAAPSNGWVHRAGDNVTARCNSSGDTWYLTCAGGQWSGQMGNCTHAAVPSETDWTIQDMFSSGTAFPFGILIAVSIGVALGVFSGGLLLALVIVRSRRRRRRAARTPQTKAIYECDKGTTRSSYATSGYDTASDKYSDWCVEGRLLSGRERGSDVRHHMMCPVQLAEREEDKALCPITDVPDVALPRPRPHMYECPKFV